VVGGGRRLARGQRDDRRDGLSISQRTIADITR
jgi:hypothetical protein